MNSDYWLAAKKNKEVINVTAAENDNDDHSDSESRIESINNNIYIKESAISNPLKLNVDINRPILITWLYETNTGLVQTETVYFDHTSGLIIYWINNNICYINNPIYIIFSLHNVKLPYFIIISL